MFRRTPPRRSTPRPAPRVDRRTRLGIEELESRRVPAAHGLLAPLGLDIAAGHHSPSDVPSPGHLRQLETVSLAPTMTFNTSVVTAPTNPAATTLVFTATLTADNVSTFVLIIRVQAPTPAPTPVTIDPTGGSPVTSPVSDPTQPSPGTPAASPGTSHGTFAQTLVVVQTHLVATITPPRFPTGLLAMPPILLPTFVLPTPAFVFLNTSQSSPARPPLLAMAGENSPFGRFGAISFPFGQVAPDDALAVPDANAEVPGLSPDVAPPGTTLPVPRPIVPETTLRNPDGSAQAAPAVAEAPAAAALEHVTPAGLTLTALTADPVGLVAGFAAAVGYWWHEGGRRRLTDELAKVRRRMQGGR
jgi:hypothetical protein